MENIYKTNLGKLFTRSLMVVVALFLATHLHAQQMSGTYTINATASASATNFTSFTAAVNALRGVTRGDGGPNFSGGITGAVTFNVTANSGPYTEQITIPAINGTSATNTITINGNNNTLRFNASNSAAMWVLRFNGIDFLTLSNLTIQTQNATMGWGIMIDNRSDNNIIQDCRIDISSVTSTAINNSVGITFTGSTTASVGFTAGSNGGIKGLNNIIRRNEIFGASNNNGMVTGIGLAGDFNSRNNHNTLIEDNVIRNWWQYGVYLYYYFDNVTFRGNDIRRGQKSSYTSYFGVYNLYCDNVNYLNNRIREVVPVGTSTTSWAYGIYNLLNTNTVSVSNYHNNLIDFRGAVSGYAIFGYYGSRHNVYHNTIYWHSPSLSNAFGTYFYDFNAGTVFDVRNNIIDMDAPTINSATCIYMWGSANYQSNNNVLPRRNNAFNHWTGHFNSNFQTLTEWRNAGRNFDINGIDVRPSYRNVAGNNFEPVTIDLDGLGAGVGVTQDINGQVRSTTNPDPGMIEFDIPVNVTAISHPTAVCQGAQTTVQVTIVNSSGLNLSNFFVQFTVNNQLLATEQFTSTLNSGQSATFTFNTRITHANTGNFTLRAMVRGKQPVSSVAYVVNPSPVGSIVTQGTPFVGRFNSGDAIDPDIVAHGDNIRYSINPPTGFANNQYNVANGWVFDFIELRTLNGTGSAGAAFTVTNPSGTNNGVASYTPIPSHSDSTYLLRYAIRSVANGCVAPVVSRRVFVAPRPIISFTSADVCEGDKVQFVNNSSISTGSIDYRWRFGDGDSTVLINPAKAYAQFGTYNVELIGVSNFGYTERATGQVRIKRNPVAEFSFTNACEGQSVNFTDASIIPSGTPNYTWSFGDGSPASTSNNPRHQFAAPGTYEVTMIVTADGCTGSSRAYVTQAPTPVANFNFQTKGCTNDEVVFSNSSNISSGTIGHSWNFGDNNLSAQNAPTHRYTTSGSFDVRLTVTSNFGCTATTTRTVTIAPSPVVGFNVGAICSRENVNITNTTIEPAGATTAYEWSMSDGFRSTSKDIQRAFNAIGSYNVMLKAVSTNGCEGEFQRTISVDEQPIASFVANDVCEGESVRFNNASVGNMGNRNYNWTIAGTTNSTARNPEVTLPAGEHNVLLEVRTPSGCSASATGVVRVNPRPSATITVNSGTRGDGTMAFTATLPTNTNYTWFFGDGGRESGNSGNQTSINTIYTYTADGVYFPSLRITTAGCTNEVSSTTSVLRTNIATISSNGLNAWPNPTNQMLNISLDAAGDEALTVKVFAVNGQEMGAVNVTNSTMQNITLDLGNLVAGVYIVRVTGSQGTYQTKVTLNK